MLDDRPLFVGMAPSRRTQLLVGDATPEAFSGTSGRRLAALAGLERDELARRVRLVNLLDRWPGYSGYTPDSVQRGDDFPMRQARERAGAYDFGGARRVVLVGKPVAWAFHLPDDEFLKWQRHRDRLMVVFPHPSGLNHWWNEPQHVDLARFFLRRLLNADERERAA